MTEDTIADQEVERATVIAKEFTAAALENHRQRLGQQGYSIEGPIGRHKFIMVEDTGQAKEMFGGEGYFAASFVKTKR
jgi:hypothetical protein